MELQYLNLLDTVLKNGEYKLDRTGVGTISIFGASLRHHLRSGFPLITTKRVPFKAVVGEMLWFIEGSQDERRLAEITYGTRDPSRTTVWTANANADYWKPKALFDGDLGRVYGVQWRSWRTFKQIEDTRGDDLFLRRESIDQLADIIHKLKTNPADRRMVMTAFNVGEMNNMALPPCHMFCQFHVNQTKNELNLSVYIRSNDLFLGLPFNIAEYAALNHMVSFVTDLSPGELIVNIGDAHIYSNHVDQVKEQLSRIPRTLPTLKIKRPVESIDDFKLEDFGLDGYDPYESIKAEMAV